MAQYLLNNCFKYPREAENPHSNLQRKGTRCKKQLRPLSLNQTWNEESG